MPRYDFARAEFARAFREARRFPRCVGRRLPWRFDKAYGFGWIEMPFTL
jgi:hypothetical protein